MKRKLIATILAVMLLTFATTAIAENTSDNAAAQTDGYTDQTVGIFRKDLTDETTTVR